MTSLSWISSSQVNIDLSFKYRLLFLVVIWGGLFVWFGIFVVWVIFLFLFLLGILFGWFGFWLFGIFLEGVVVFFPWKSILCTE